ncbi:hypothetical protein TYRP_007290 [Tyrophagus putrescentiae]|nr:hypothetical protein TYRP_007290 [Tyrophagus putrescentiae]
MLKHVSTGNAFKLSKYSDTISLNSSVSSNDSRESITDSSSDAAISPSRSSSSSSIHYIETPKVVIKIYTRVLCTDVEYKTLSIYNHTTSKSIVQMILNKFRLKHRDPKLFYLTLEAWIKQTGIPIRSVMTLEDDSCPALLQSCYTQDLKFTLMMRRGGIVKVYDTCFQHGPLYKNLLISNRTTVLETIQLLLNCCDSTESYSKFALYEICPSHNTERLMKGDEVPLAIQSDWPNPDFSMFQLRYCETETVCQPKAISSFSHSMYNFKKNFKNELRNSSLSSAAAPAPSTVKSSSSSSCKPDKLLYI